MLDMSHLRFPSREFVRNEAEHQWSLLTSKISRVGPASLVTNPDDGVVGRVVRSGRQWESWMHQYFIEYCDPNEISLDVGANIGAHSVVMSGLAAQVHSFEPHPGNYALLERNVAHLGVICHQVALGPREEELFISSPRTNHGMAELGASCDGAIRVRSIPLDSMSFDRRVGFVKIDAEKSEVGVLRGAMATIREHQPVVILEDQSRARRLLELEGYECRRIALVDWLCIPTRRPSFLA